MLYSPLTFMGKHRKKTSCRNPQVLEPCFWYIASLWGHLPPIYNFRALIWAKVHPMWGGGMVPCGMGKSEWPHVG